MTSARLLNWLLFRPAAWRAQVRASDIPLAPHFCLAEVDRAFWADPVWRRIVIQWLLLWPSLAWLVALATKLLLAPGTAVGSRGVLVGLVAGLSVAVFFATIVSLIVGGPAGMVAAAAVTLIAPPDDPLLYLVLSPGVGLVMGLIAGITGYALSAVEERSRATTPARRLGGLVIGILVSSIGLIIVFGVPAGMVLAWQQRGASNGSVAVATGLMPALIIGVTIGLRTRRWRRALAFGAAGGLLIGCLTWLVMRNVGFNTQIGGLALLMPFLIIFLSSFLILYTLPFVIAERIAGPWAGAIAGLLGSQALHPITEAVFIPYPAAPNLMAGLGAGVLLLTMGWWRPLLFYPFQAAWHTLLYRLEGQRRPAARSLLRHHAAFWDEQQRLPFVGLDDHLLLVMERFPDEARGAIDQLSAGHQRWAVQAAQIETDARFLERAGSVEQIAAASPYLGAGRLEGPASALLRTLGRVSQDVAAALRQHSAYNQRLALAVVADHLDSLQRELTRSDEPYAERFRPVAIAWQSVITTYGYELKEAVERRQEIDNPYVIGVPLTAQQAVFVGRTDTSRRIESLLLDRRRPPLLLYGQRRMGKTSLLNNLGRLLPNAILPLFVDLQGHVSYASDLPGFFYNIARAMARSAEELRGVPLPLQSRTAFLADPLTTFDEWLDDVERAAYGAGADTILLMLDEFEALDSALTTGRLSEEAVLGSLRHLIQHRPRFKVLLAGSHPLHDFQRWAGYFINTQVVHLDYLREDEARQLVEQPVKGFTLMYAPAASRRVLELTRGHPFLLQLLCGEVVSLKNEQDPDRRRFALVEDVEAAAHSALEVGSMFFADIQWNQIDSFGRELLHLLTTIGEDGAMPLAELEAQYGAHVPNASGREVASVLKQLIRKGIVESAADGYRFQVELIRRWFCQLPDGGA
ncbi:MAG TPA: ATP-binding protein [Promineifilum sp.]|nr:ATP-binding protein [Promineifilum sp.]